MEGLGDLEEPHEVEFVLVKWGNARPSPQRLANLLVREGLC